MRLRPENHLTKKFEETKQFDKVFALTISFFQKEDSRMEGGSSAADGSAAAQSGEQTKVAESGQHEENCKSGQQMTNEKDNEKCEKGEQETTKDNKEKGSGLVARCRDIVGMGLFVTVIKNIISGINDVMVKTTFSGINPITLVFLRYLHGFYHISGYVPILEVLNNFDIFI